MKHLHTVVTFITTLLVLVLSTTITVDFVGAWNCAAKMVMAQVARDTLPAGDVTFIDDALNYQYLVTGLSTMAELPCWASNLTTSSSSSSSQQQHPSYASHYKGWNRFLQCYNPAYPTSTTKKNDVPQHVECPQRSAEIEGVLPVAMDTAIQTLRRAATTVRQQKQHQSSSTSLASGALINGADATSTTGFWISMLLDIVAAAHQPSSMCSLYDSLSPDGDDGGKKFFVRMPAAGAQSAKKVSIRDLTNTAADLLDIQFPHPIMEFPDAVAELKFLSSSLISELAQHITAAEVRDMSIESWAREAKNLCETVVYRNETSKQVIERDGTISSEHLKKLRFQLQRRLVLAGRRFAHLLNWTLQHQH